MTDLDARSHSVTVRSAALVLAAALLGGCANRVSDQPVKPLADVCGGGSRISSALGGFNGPAPWEQDANTLSKNCPYPQELAVYASCLSVTAVDLWDETGDGAVGTVYVQDNVPAPAPVYAGTSLYGTSFSPPNLRLEPGDVIDVTGTYEEWQGPSSLTAGAFQYCETLPQIAGAASFRFDGAVPAPVVIQPDDLSSYASGRRYMNMLVRVENVVLAETGSSSSGRYSAKVIVSNGTQWTIGNPLFDLPNQMPLLMNDSFTSVTGIVTWFQGYTLAPRRVADFQKPGQPLPDGG